MGADSAAAAKGTKLLKQLRKDVQNVQTTVDLIETDTGRIGESSTRSGAYVFGLLHQKKRKRKKK